jgi:UTP-glucose-1-phosphate uridylyltransferase
MAAGIGSRYGGIKQIDAVGPSGEAVIDYSVFDALRSGFKKIVFVIRQEIEAPFKERIGDRMGKSADITYVLQELDALPAGVTVPSDRKKPWGTGHAVLCCKDVVKTPFAVINADDFYGRRSFATLARYLKDLKNTDGLKACAMVGFVLENTLSEHGFVSRGVCSVSAEGYLTDVTERTRIEPRGGVPAYTLDGATWVALPRDSIVSMNMWGFVPALFDELENRFVKFLHMSAAAGPGKEFYISDMIGTLTKEKIVAVKVLPTPEQWFGMTYREDVAVVKLQIGHMIENGIYPKKLWE